MNKIISWLKNITVRVIVTVFLVELAFLFNATLSSSNAYQAQAKPLTPEATSYQVDNEDGQYAGSEIAQSAKDSLGSVVDKVKGTLNQSAEESAEGKAQKAGEDVSNTVQDKLENAGDDIREKLNLDQPIYPGTKRFLGDVQDRAEQRVKGQQPNAQDAPRGQQPGISYD